MMEFDQKTPIYQQLAGFIRSAILAGDLPEEEAIPSVRQISVDEGLNPQTVLNATQMLVQEGLVEKRRGLGYYVAKGAREALRKNELDRFQQEEVPRFVQNAMALGLAVDQLEKLVRSAFGKDGR